MNKIQVPKVKIGYSLFILLFLIVSSCDIFTPKSTFKLAVPKNDYTYLRTSGHLVSFLEQGGFKIKIIYVDNAIEANLLVAQGKADLTFIMNHSNFIPEVLGTESGKLRTICPMFERLFFLFSKDSINNNLNAREILKGKRIGIEVLDGESYTDLRNLLNSSKIEDVQIVHKDSITDYIHFWGTFYGDRATLLLENGWKEVSLSPSWTKFLTLNNSSLNEYVLPAIPGVEGSQDLNTIATHTLLVGNSKLGEKAIFELSAYIYQHKLDLMKYDIMYRSINEAFDVSNLLYPLHIGTDAYFRRDQPTFFEKYADILALVLSFGALIYGVIQAIRNKLQRMRKEKIDLYFIEYLDIKSKKVNKETKIILLENLLKRALLQMTSENMEKNDFHILAHLLQQELTNMISGSENNS